MKYPSDFLTNTTTPAGRAGGQAINDPGGDTGTGVDQEIYNDPAYAIIATVDSWKEGGISSSHETTINSDMRDAIEEMGSIKVSGISDYAPTTSYINPGTLTDLVMWKGFQFINISAVANLGNDPLANPTLWFKIPKVDKLMDDSYSGDPINGGMSPMSNRAGSQYLQNMLFGKYRLGGNGDDFYNFYRVALDGTVITGDATLEAIFDVGGLNQYPYLDLYAPDVVGTRTLLDMGEYITTPMSVGGENDILAQLQDDRGQGHWHEGRRSTSNGQGGINETYSGSGADNQTPSSATITAAITDTVNGTPRTGLTTRPKEFTVGASYIIVMQQA